MVNTLLPFIKTPQISIGVSYSVLNPEPVSFSAVGLIGHQTQKIAGVLPKLTPAIGFPQIEYFKTYQLPDFSSPNEAMTYMKNLGFVVNYGLSGELVLPPPTAVTLDTDGVTVVLEYTTTPANYELLLNSSLQATVTQGSATGTFVSADVNAAKIYVTPTSGTFSTTGNVSLSYIDFSKNIPDPLRTDEIALFVYNFFSVTTGIVAPRQFSLIRPLCYIAVLTDREVDGAFSPNSAPLSLGSPNEVVVQTDGSVYLGWTTAPTNSVYVPLSVLGQTKISQGASIYGYVNQVLPEFTIAACEFCVRLVAVEGVFAASTATTLTLDSTANVFSYFNDVTLTAIVSPYEVKTAADITTNQKEFFDYIAFINQNTQVENKHFGTSGVFANISASPYNPNSLPSNVDNCRYIPVYYPYSPLFGEVTQYAGQVASALAAFYSCNSAPFNPMSGLVIPGLFASQNRSNNVIPTAQGSASSEPILKRGWTPLCVNSNFGVYPVRVITGMQTIPGTQVADTEFFPATVWQIQTLFVQSLYSAFLIVGVKQRRASPVVIASLRGAIIALMGTFEAREMFANTDFWAEKVTVAPSNIPGVYLVDVPIQVIPELSGIDAKVSLVSILFQIA